MCQHIEAKAVYETIYPFSKLTSESSKRITFRTST